MFFVNWYKTDPVALKFAEVKQLMCLLTMSVCLPFCLSVCLSACLCFGLSLCLSLCLVVCVEHRAYVKPESLMQLRNRACDILEGFGYMCALLPSQMRSCVRQMQPNLLATMQKLKTPEHPTFQGDRDSW